jgi:BirA family biotin operon repressor/biotin-[acetyl-CoA-carboxylase] ligase
MNFSLLTYDILDSTNTEALKQAKAGAGEGLCVIARQQTAGRGRYGRTWVSERDAGLYFSIVLRPRIRPNDLPLITLMAGIAVYDTLAEFGIKPDIKWVNDVLVNDKKIAGVLAETTDTSDGVAVVVGIGINLRASNLATATSLEDCSATAVSSEDLVEVLTRNLASFYELLQTEHGGLNIIENWSRRSSYSSGKNIRAVLGNETINGVTDGLEDNGALRIKRDDGSVATIQAGDVEQVRAAT